MITILIGVSGSGKSTLSKMIQEVSVNPVVRVNRDSLRHLLYSADQTDEDYYNNKHLKSREKFISEVSDQLIYDALNKGYDVIIDNTNLERKYIEDFIRKFNHLSSIELIFMHGTDVSEKETFRNRLIKRFGSVDRVGYLDKQWNKYANLKRSMHGKQLLYLQSSSTLMFDSDNPKTYLVDIDGTIAKRGDRDIYDDTKLHVDTEITPVGDVIRSLHKSGYVIIYVSGRQDKSYDPTKEWLEKNNLWFDDTEMYMRKTNDVRADYLIKEEIILNDIVPKYNVVGVFDDRLQVTREYYRLGIHVFNVNQDLVQF